MDTRFSMKEIGTKDGATVIYLAGRLDARGAGQLAVRCRSVADVGGRVVLVLRDVELLSSSGIGTLLALVEEFGEAGRTIRLACPSPAVSQAIGLLNLDEYLPFYANEEEALTREAA